MPVRSDGAEIRRRRKLIGLSLTEFAQRMGYTLDHVSRVELDKKPAGPRFLRKAAEIFGCNVSDLMTEDTGDPDNADTTETPRAVA
jgi:transcriptional regulator with XRE-family HTH domain